MLELVTSQHRPTPSMRLISTASAHLPPTVQCSGYRRVRTGGGSAREAGNRPRKTVLVLVVVFVFMAESGGGCYTGNRCFGRTSSTSTNILLQVYSDKAGCGSMSAVRTHPHITASCLELPDAHVQYNIILIPAQCTALTDQPSPSPSPSPSTVRSSCLTWTPLRTSTPQHARAATAGGGSPNNGNAARHGAERLFLQLHGKGLSAYSYSFNTALHYSERHQSPDTRSQNCPNPLRGYLTRQRRSAVYPATTTIGFQRRT